MKVLYLVPRWRETSASVQRELVTVLWMVAAELLVSLVPWCDIMTCS